MKNTFFAIIAAALTIFGASAQSRFTPGSDTILFDGESVSNTRGFNINYSDDCQWEVEYIRGKVTGTTTRLELVTDMCGGHYENVTSEYELKNGDMVFTNGNIKTGPLATIQLTRDGNTIRIGPNSSVSVECNGTIGEEFVPDSKKISVKLILGTIWSKVVHALRDENAMQVQTSRSIAGTRGTVFSFETKIENGVYTDILRTLEGKMEFWGNAENKIDKEELQRQTDILEEDFKAGRITLEEFTAKVKKLSDPAVNTIEQYHVFVESGNESVIRGIEPPTSPSKFIETGDEWYLDKNFEK